jgi:hypothetical protein
MSGGGFTGRDDEVVNIDYVQGSVTVGVTQVEAKVGGSRLDGRQMLRIYNGSNAVVYFGPTGVTTSNGEPIEKKQWINIPIGDALALYLIAGSAANDVIVSEWS